MKGLWESMPDCVASLPAPPRCPPQLRPEWPPGAHPALVKLGRACLDARVEKRPSFEAIVKVRGGEPCAQQCRPTRASRCRLRVWLRPYRHAALVPCPPSAGCACAVCAVGGVPQRIPWLGARPSHPAGVDQD